MYSCISSFWQLANSNKADVINPKGQATVEAAFMIPIVFLLLLMLVQPTILLYNQIVMENAAGESCRLMSTNARQGSHSEQRYEEYIQRRLAAIPPVDIFHVSPDGKGWSINLEGGEGSKTVTITITHRVKPLPLIGLGAGILGQLDKDGYLTQEVKVVMPTQPDWAFADGVGSPSSWPGQWED
ncbi:MAG: pilus assembly protein [Coriobacteriales bacterium]|jgi:hypothetical protein|nr:pilus assembly protein [Coriobacteriales bacterium]